MTQNQKELPMIDLMHGDCLELMKDIPDDSVDMVLTDPPYKTTKRGTTGTGGIFKTDISKKGKLFKENNFDIADILLDLKRIMKEGAHGYLFTNNKNLKKYLIEISSVFKIFKVLIWSKNNCITNMFYMDSHEYIIFFRNGMAKKINNCSSKSVMFYDNPRDKLHPTQKPIELLEHLILNSSSINETVLDFTMGSGSTGVACKNLNRNFIGIEKDDNYFKIAYDRING